MNVKKLIKISALTLSVIFIFTCISIGVFAYKNNITSLEEAKAYAENIFHAEKNDILHKLSDYEFNDILSEIKQLESTKNSDRDTLSYYHLALADKMKTASKNDITSAILDTELSADSRATIIISAEANEIPLDYDRLSDAIGNDKYADIRPLLIELIGTETPDNIDEIEKIVDNKSEGFSKAIKTLWEIKPTKAIAVADEVLNSYSGEYDEIFRGSFIVKSYQARLDPTDNNCMEFISLCDRIINTPCKDSEDREIYIISVLEEIQNKNILIYCKDKGFSNRMGGPNVAFTLESLLDEPASTENIELFLHYYPQIVSQNIWQAVNEHLSNNTEFYNNNSELKLVLEQISSENYEVVSILSEPNESKGG